MEPQIQYCTTSDGVSIAYWRLGQGRPFVHLPWFPFSHIQLEWQISECRRWYECLAANMQLVRYDGRGAGLSERVVSDLSLDARVSDLEAVIDHAGLDGSAIFGFGHSGMVATAYAAKHPDRVSHLLLSHSYRRIGEFAQSPQIRAMAAMLYEDWELFTQTTAHALLGWSEGEPARKFAALIREAVTHKFTRASFAAFADVDITGFLAEITCPTLILHRRQVSWLGVDVARNLASQMANARLALLEGGSSAPWLGDIAAELDAINDFLGQAGVRRELSPAVLPSGTAIILFTDIVDSTALTERMGDAAFRGRARELDGALRSAIRGCGGTAVEGKLLGDGVLAVFTSAREAIAAALGCRGAGEAAGLPLHLGVHAGDVIREEDNVYGGAVNIASRIAGASAPGEILVSDTVRSLARTSAGVAFEDRGEHALKGVGEPVRVYAVRAESA